MMAVYTWGNVDFLIDCPSPLSPKKVLQIAQTALGVLAFLHEKGILLDDIGLHNFLLDRESDLVYFFDPVIREIYDGPVPEDQRSSNLSGLADTLRKLLGVEHVAIHDFLETASRQVYRNTYEMGIEKLLDGFSAETIDPDEN